MQIRRSLWTGLAILLAWLGGAASPASTPATPKPAPLVCGALGGSHQFAEPPDVDVWTLPVNAGDEHELILTVHTDGQALNQRFCYHYVEDGVEQTVAPTIRVRRGEHFAIRVVNEIGGPSKAARLASTQIPPCMPMPMPTSAVTHYVGYLNHTIDDRFMPTGALDTNLHLHGYQGPASEENVFLSTLSSPLHACEYHVTIPATQPAGTYMYHPHAHGSSGAEVAAGLDGVWIVEPDTPQLPRSDEHVIMLRYRIPVISDNPYAPDEDAIGDVAMKHEAALKPAPPAPYDPLAPPPWPVTFPMTAGGVTLDPTGCNGDASEVMVAANGADTPVAMPVPAGRPQLLRIANGTSDSASALQLRDAAGTLVPLHLVALDGIPISGDSSHPLASYVATTKLMLTAMSRADILITVSQGEKLTLSSEHYCGGKDAFFEMHHDLVKIVGVASDAPPAPAVTTAPAVIAETPEESSPPTSGPIRHRYGGAPLRSRSTSFRRKARFRCISPITSRRRRIRTFTSIRSGPSIGPARRSHPNADVVVKRGTVEEWYLVNATMEAHAFHIHQMSFAQSRAVEGVPLMADTVFVPVGTLLPNPHDPNYPLIKPRITKILLDFRNVQRGTFVFHCHMLFHEDRGMMAIVKVV